MDYDQQPLSLSPGDELRVALYWQPKEELAEDYRSCVHLVDEDGRIIAQSDHQPGGDYYPTSLWRPGETLPDAHTLTIPLDAPRGTYRLLVGMYLYPSMEPLGQILLLGQIDLPDEPHTTSRANIQRCAVARRCNPYPRLAFSKNEGSASYWLTNQSTNASLYCGDPNFGL